MTQTIGLLLIVMLLWGSYAVRRQVKINGWDFKKVLIVWIINTIFWPICMVVAIVRGE